MPTLSELNDDAATLARIAALVAPRVRMVITARNFPDTTRCEPFASIDAFVWRGHELTCIDCDYCPHAENAYAYADSVRKRLRAVCATLRLCGVVVSWETDVAMDSDGELPSSDWLAQLVYSARDGVERT